MNTREELGKKPKIRFRFGVVLLITASFVSAQSYRGSIRGKVLDASGSAIAGAKISAKSAANGLMRDTSTGPDGGYVLVELPAGEYRVSAQAAGLSPVAQTVVVAVGLDTTANFDLTKVETRSEHLTVIATAPVVDETRDVLGEVVDRKLVDELPLNGRDFGKLVALVPGATVEPSGVAAVEYGFGQFSINGNRDRSNNYTLDGTDNNDPYFNNSAMNQTGIGGAPASLLPIDAIQEFNLQSQFPAEYGRNSGSVINIITRSGTNLFHGSVFEFVRNDLFDARNFFNRDVDADGNLQPKTGFHNNQFGASLGGPIIKDKTFFFGAYEGQRERVGSNFSLLVPTATQLSEAQTIMADMGTPASPALTGILTQFFPVSATGLYPGVVNDSNDVDSLIAKVDHQFSNHESVSARYAYASSQQVFPLGSLGGFGSGSRLPEFAQTSPTRVQIVSASLLSSLSPHKLNEIRFGYSRYTTSFSSLDATFNPSTLGIDFGTGKPGLPELDFGGVFDNLGATAYSIPRGRTSQSFQILDNFTLESGRHTFKFGGEYRRAIVSSFNDNLERGLFSFSAADPSNLAPCSQAVPVAGCADPGVLTLISYYQGDTFPSIDAGNTQRTTFNNGLSFFVQDDFRAMPHLTLNLGLRWEYFGPIGEENHILANLGTDGVLHMVGTGGVNDAYNRDLNNFGPRFGFAWSPRSGTVVRGGYGIYFDYIPQDLMIANFTNDAGLVTPPLGPEPVISLANNYNQTAFSNPAPGVPVFTVPPGPYPIAGSDIFFTPRNLETPYGQNWNFNIQQELATNVAFQLGYVGSKGTRLVRLRDANQPDINGNRPNPNYGFMDEFAELSSSTYNALQATLRVQESHGFSGFAGYTFSKSLDDASDGIDYNSSTVALPQNSNDLKAEHGPSNFDNRHRFTAAFNYQLPRFRGPRRLSDGWQLNTIFTVLSGRPVPIVNSNDTSGANANVSPTPSNFHQRPNVVPGVNPINPNWESAPDTIGYLNGNAFANPPYGTFGDLGRNSIYGPQYWQLDFALNKNTVLSEKVNLQLRVELFNILNHPNFALPNWFVLPGQPGQGLITQTPDQAQTNPGLGGGGPRVIQLAAKMLF
jgi:hypothetical protein